MNSILSRSLLLGLRHLMTLLDTELLSKMDPNEKKEVEQLSKECIPKLKKLLKS